MKKLKEEVKKTKAYSGSKNVRENKKGKLVLTQCGWFWKQRILEDKKDGFLASWRWRLERERENILFKVFMAGGYWLL